jgi:ferredoxin
MMAGIIAFLMRFVGASTSIIKNLLSSGDFWCGFVSIIITMFIPILLCVGVTCGACIRMCATCIGMLQIEFEPSGLASTRKQYARLNLRKGSVARWEDGTRTNSGEPGTYECWYLECHLDDGGKLVFVVYTKRMMTVGKGLSPYATFDWNGGDGKHIKACVEVPGCHFYASKDRCDVQMGQCYIRGGLNEYEFYFKNKVVEAKV